MHRKTGVLITGGDFQALGAVRTLSKKGVPVIVLEEEFSISRFSRFTKKTFRSPSLSSKSQYIEFLMNLAEKRDLKGWIIFPNSDEAVCLFAKYRNVLQEYYRVPTPPWEVVQYVYIKKNTYKIAEANGISIPKTYYSETLEDLLNQVNEFPLIIKPSIRDNFYSKVKIKAFRVEDRDELIKVYKRVCSIIDPNEVLVQEFIPGGPTQLYSFCPFFKNGKAIVSIMARRSRQHPMDFGHASTFAELVDIPQIKLIGEKFLNLIGYYGIGEVEFMYDKRDDRFKLIEVNPRIWGWHSLAIAAGADLPYFLYQDMIGEKISLQPISNNVRWVRLVTDLPTGITEVVKGNLILSDYINSLKGKKEFAVFSADDPIPFFAEIIMIPYLYMKRGF